MPGDLFCRGAFLPRLRTKITVFIEEFMAGLLHFTDKMLNFKYQTKNRRIIQDEAVAALVMLGFPQAASQKVVQKLVKENPTLKVESLIKTALKML